MEALRNTKNELHQEENKLFDYEEEGNVSERRLKKQKDRVAELQMDIWNQEESLYGSTHLNKKETNNDGAPAAAPQDLNGATTTTGTSADTSTARNDVGDLVGDARSDSSCSDDDEDDYDIV